MCIYLQKVDIGTILNTQFDKVGGSKFNTDSYYSNVEDVPLKDLCLFYTSDEGEVRDFEFSDIRDPANRGKCMRYKLTE